MKNRVRKLLQTPPVMVVSYKIKHIKIYSKFYVIIQILGMAFDFITCSVYYCFLLPASDWCKDNSFPFQLTDPKCAHSPIHTNSKRRNVCWERIFLTYNPHFPVDAITWEYKVIISWLPCKQDIITTSLNLYIVLMY